MILDSSVIVQEVHTLHIAIGQGTILFVETQKLAANKYRPIVLVRLHFVLLKDNTCHLD